VADQTTGAGDMQNMRTTTHTRGDRRRQLCVVAAAISCAVAVGGCGVSAKTNTTGTFVGQSQVVEFAACMRAHGVPNFPDPAGGGGAIQVPVGSGMNPSSPGFKAAQQHCRSLLPSGPGPGRATAQQVTRAQALTRCMRAHGISGFPDPTSSQPSIASGAYTLVWGRPGAYVAVPSTISLQSPTFKHAAIACKAPF
jgi:hypothetical protein